MFILSLLKYFPFLQSIFSTRRNYGAIRDLDGLVWVVLLLGGGFSNLSPVEAAPRGRSGVQMVDQGAAFYGYRLISSRYSERARLIDSKGMVINQWSYPQGYTWHNCRLLPNGHFVAIVENQMLIELDWQGNLVRQLAVEVHHDFEYGKNGEILMLTREPAVGVLATGKGDAIMEIMPSGEISWEWRFLDHVDSFAVAKRDGERLGGVNSWPEINSISLIEDSKRNKKDGVFQEGNILISCRFLNTLVIIEKSSGKIVWDWGVEELHGPHSATFLKNGNILVFDSGYDEFGEGRGYSRALELNPESRKIVWSYENKSRFFSKHRGSVQRLPNGNTLIAQGDVGRMFEVNQKGEIVWEYQMPSKQPTIRVLAYDKALFNFHR